MWVSGYWGWGMESSLSRTLHRFIKRKKFDDELVESSLAKSSTRAKGASAVEPGRCSGSEPSSSEKKKVRIGRMGSSRGWGPVPDFVFPHNLRQLARALQRRLVRGSSRPSPNLRCLPPGSPSHYSPFLAAPRPPHHHPVSTSCITFCVGGIERASILGADSLFPALLGVKITPRWHCSGPRHCTSKSVFLVSSPPTLYSGVGGTISKKKTPYGLGLCRSTLMGAGMGRSWY